jgi:hypothetical protein
MKDDRPWAPDNFNARLSVLQKDEPEKQVNLGMQRSCEHDLVVEIAVDHDVSTYVEIGSGNGLLLHRVKKAMPKTRVIGFESVPDTQTIKGCANKGIEMHSQDVLEDGGTLLEQQIKTFVEESEGPVFVYTDNGNKPMELSIISKHMRAGDICGSHDFSGPNWSGFVGFLRDRNFLTLKKYENYIIDHLCLQRFWEKQQDTVTENPCDHFV